jgi:general secretion pathway protein I
MSRANGFTLIEVMVALGIVAIALLVGIKSTDSLGRSAQRQALSHWGQLCADNELIRLRLLRKLPDIGNSQVDCPQAGMVLQVRLAVQVTPNPNFRRVDAQVFFANEPLLQLSSIMGRD